MTDITGDYDDLDVDQLAADTRNTCKREILRCLGDLDVGDLSNAEEWLVKHLIFNIDYLRSELAEWVKQREVV